MTEKNRVFVTSILITGIVVLLTTAGSTWFLYHTAVEEQKERLLEMVKSQAKFIEVVHDSSLVHVEGVNQQHHQGCSSELTTIFLKLSKAYTGSAANAGGSAPVLKFHIAEKNGDYVNFHVGTKKLTSKPTLYKKIVGKPMGKALNGETNVLRTKDHMGNPILCAYTNVQPIALGIVAKIFLKDLRRPFLRTGFMTYIAAFGLIFLSGMVMKMMVSPLVATLEKQRKELELKNKYLLKQATTDTLTGLYNRQYFNEHLEHGICSAQRYNTLVSLIIIDVDNFKQINDTYGHLTGDGVLEELSGLLKSKIRKSDILARWGGEEFIILIFESGVNETSLIASKIVQAVEAHNFGFNQTVTCSAGVTVYLPEESANDFIGRADKGLYEAKQTGKNRVVAK